MVICAFENSPSIPSFLATQIVSIGYGQFKKQWLLFLLYLIFFIWQTPEIQWKKSLSSKMCYIYSWHFWQHISMAIFSGKRYFIDILWAQAYKLFFHWISGVCQIKNIKYIHQYTRRPFH
jgi:hypothetical protein